MMWENDLAEGEKRRGCPYVGSKWHVRVFEMRETKRGLLGSKRRVSKGYSWSASGQPEGYLFGAKTFASIEETEEDARLRVADEGGTVTSISLPSVRQA